MHILVTNDDGPPSVESSPYILAFVRTLEAAGHTVSVILPNTQRSWIGKAHIVGQDVTAVYYWPPLENPQTHSDTVSRRDDTKHPWVLVNATPAGAAQIGLHYFFADRGPIDLVVSGPNYGRNTSAVFALSSGTLGAALEAAVCGHKAIALSFAFTDRLNKPEIVAQSCEQSVRVISWLYANARWDDARLYSVNVPVSDGVKERRVVWTRMLQNQWGKGACFTEMEANAAHDRDPNEEEARLRRQQGKVESEKQSPKAIKTEVDTETGSGPGPESTATRSDVASTTPDLWRERHFKWAPQFGQIYDWVQRAGPGSDGWVVKEGETSVTAIKANFMHVDGYEGEVKL